MKKILITLVLIISSLVLSSCETQCCDDGLGHCCITPGLTCPSRDTNSWWY